MERKKGGKFQEALGSVSEAEPFVFGSKLHEASHWSVDIPLRSLEDHRQISGPTPDFKLKKAL